MAKFLYTSALFLLMALRITTVAAEEEKTFETEYATIYYKDVQDLKRFFWRISGHHIDMHTYPGFAKSRIDRIVEKVQAILDMHPVRFHVAIRVHPEYAAGPAASYSEETKSIAVYADRITDAALGHEVSHAVMSSYFKSPPPPAVREILSQYVDRHLWAE